jgi:hypothetical protein
VLFATTGSRAAPKPTPSRNAVNGAIALSTMGEWNAVATSSRFVVIPAALRTDSALATASVPPESTT